MDSIRNTVVDKSGTEADRNTMLVHFINDNAVESANFIESLHGTVFYRISERLKLRMVRPILHVSENHDEAIITAVASITNDEMGGLQLTMGEQQGMMSAQSLHSWAKELRLMMAIIMILPLAPHGEANSMTDPEEPDYEADEEGSGILVELEEMWTGATERLNSLCTPGVQLALMEP